MLGSSLCVFEFAELVVAELADAGPDLLPAKRLGGSDAAVPVWGLLWGVRPR
jgi:hypothetical protein